MVENASLAGQLIIIVSPVSIPALIVLFVMNSFTRSKVSAHLVVILLKDVPSAPPNRPVEHVLLIPLSSIPPLIYATTAIKSFPHAKSVPLEGV